MRVGIWSGLGRSDRYITGVGKHIVRVAEGLARCTEGNLELIIPKERGANAQPSGGVPQMFSDFEVKTLPYGRRTLEAIWTASDALPIDRWAPDCDWIYSPKESHAPVGRAKRAITVHDLYGLETDLHGERPSMGQRQYFRLLRRALKKSDLVLAVSEFTSQRLQDLMAVPGEKIRVIGNGVDEAFFAHDASEKSEIKAAESQPYLLAVGGITKKKGAEALLELVGNMVETCPEVTVRVIGPVEQSYKARVDALPNLEVVGRGLDDDGLRALLAGAQGLLQLSLYEGFGIPALEAMAVSTPVIAADRASMPEVVGDAAILVDCCEPDSVLSAVNALMSDDALRRDLVQKGHQQAQEFTWDRCADRVFAALKEFS